MTHLVHSTDLKLNKITETAFCRIFFLFMISLDVQFPVIIQLSKQKAPSRFIFPKHQVFDIRNKCDRHFVTLHIWYLKYLNI